MSAAQKVKRMSDYSKNLKWLIKNSPYTQKEIAAIMGVSESVISRLVTKEASDLEIVDKICEIIKVPIIRVFNRKAEDTSTLTAQEKELLEEFNKMPPERREMLLAFIRVFK